MTMGRQKCQVFVSCSMLKSNNWCINILWRGWVNYSRRIINNQHYTCSHRPRHEFLMLAEIMHYFSIYHCMYFAKNVYSLNFYIWYFLNAFKISFCQLPPELYQKDTKLFSCNKFSNDCQMK